MLRRLATILALTPALALPVASAHAADPLLSGYAGPGGGEQVVLGSTTVKTTKSSSGSSSASQPNPGDQSLAAATPSASTSSAASDESEGASSTITRKPQRKKSSSSTSKDAGDDEQTTTTGSGTTTTTTATQPGAPAVVAYPTRAGEVSGLPVSAAGILLLVLGIAAATLLGLGLRRFSGSDDPHDPQVPAA
jgi:hypothetical protein